jgi:hypothetical protein
MESSSLPVLVMTPNVKFINVLLRTVNHVHRQLHLKLVKKEPHLTTKLSLMVALRYHNTDLLINAPISYCKELHVYCIHRTTFMQHIRFLDKLNAVGLKPVSTVVFP